MGDPEFVALASAARSKKALTANIRQRKFAREYVKSGNATQAAKIVYRMKQDSAEEYSRRLLKMPKIQVEVEKAMEKHGLDSDYALENIKKIVNAGTANLDATRPGDMLKALEMILKLKGLLGNRVVDENSESRIREKVAALGLPEIQKELAELDKNQKRLLDWTKEKVTEAFKLARKEHPQCLICMTDGEMVVPQNPGVPVLWLATNDWKAPYGKTVKMS